MAGDELHSALLRPAVIQILRSMGFNLAKPTAIDTLTDLTARYLSLLASETAQVAVSNHDNNSPTIQDVRLALGRVGALRPQMNSTEEAVRPWVSVDGVMVPFEDLRGVQNLIQWAEGPLNKEIRRVGGLDGGESDNVADLAAGMDENEDYVTAIKKKHSKTAEESRFQGTTLGKDSDLQPITIAGPSAESLSHWNAARSRAAATAKRSTSPASSAVSSALSTPLDSATPGQG